MIHLKEISIRKDSGQPDAFPFNLPLIKNLPALTLASPVTFFVGENGSGKSTLLEAIAAAAGSITVGSMDAAHDKTLASSRSLARELKLAWNKRTHKGFFLRAEDFFGYAKRLAQMKEELQADLNRVDQEYSQRSELAASLAKMPHMSELNALEQRYGEGLDAASHGESFLQLFQARFVPDGLYLLDEPEAPLSPLRQLSFISLLKQMVAENAQFIIATHSPILMAFPNADIYDFDSSPVKIVPYNELKHVEITRGFLNNPTAYLNHL